MTMICPRCRQDHDALAFTPMGLVEEFKENTVQVYKCPVCRWIFAPVSGGKSVERPRRALADRPAFDVQWPEQAK
jgi:Zn finger protein HypA/HybF involved in hydrogenase expression